MPVPTHNGAVVLPDPPDWRQPLEWSRGWDTQVEAALSGAEARLGIRPKPREQLRFRVEAAGLVERLRLVQRLRAAAKSGLAIVPHWGRSATLASEASDTTLILDGATFQTQPGDAVFVVSAPDDFEVGEVSAHRGTSITLTAPLARTHPPGAAVFPAIAGRIVISDLDALDDWHQAVTVEVRQLRTVPNDDTALFQFDYWMSDGPIPRFFAGGALDEWLAGAPIVSP